MLFLYIGGTSHCHPLSCKLQDFICEKHVTALKTNATSTSWLHTSGAMKETLQMVVVTV